ncbi:MAG: adenine deaminase [Betaproteobacteria bacterium]|nr:adenine deaminase [Betaproteobacteria bacterium]
MFPLKWGIYKGAPPPCSAYPGKGKVITNYFAGAPADDPFAPFSSASPAVGADLAPGAAEIQRLRAVAGGKEPGDIIIRGGKMLSLHTGEILERDVVIAGRHIAAVTPAGRFDAPRIIDARGLHVAPTFIDTHIHIEYTKLTPGELARLSVPRGTTTLLADANCIANVLGEEGFDIVGRTGTPLRIFRQVTPRVPQRPLLEMGGAKVGNQEIIDRVQAALAVSFGESNPFDMDPWTARKQAAALAAGKRLTGHTARLRDEPLWSYLAGGISDDHNAVTTDEVLERLRLGAMLTVMAGSMNDNCASVFADLGALGDGLFHMAFCVDDRLAEDIEDEGHIDHLVRQAIKAGVKPMHAYRMGSLSPAIYYRLDHLIGSITPSRLADLQLLPDLAAVRPTLVMVNGQVVAENGRALFANTDRMPATTRNTMRLHPELSAGLFAVKATGASAWVQAMEMYDGYFKRAFHAELPVVYGTVRCDPGRDVLKVAIVDRHHASKTLGLGYVRGFGLKRGALAATTNCTNQNLVMVGTSDEDLAHAARTAGELGGGLVVVAGGKVLASVPLPIAGIMSDQPWEIVREQSIAADAAARELGCDIRAPFLIMSFIGLAGVPDLGLTERGLIETRSQSFIDVVLQTRAGMVCCRCPQHRHSVHRLMDFASFQPPAS